MGDTEDAVFRCPDLHREVSSFVMEREVVLIQALQAAIDLAPDVDRGLAALTLVEARRSQLDRLSEAGGPEVPPIPPEVPPMPAAGPESDWSTMVNHITVGAKLGVVFFTALQDLLKDEEILPLEVALRDEPATPEILWTDALAHQDRVPAAVFKVINGCTQGLLARPALQARIGHDGTLNLFATTFDSLSLILKGPGSPTL